MKFLQKGLEYNRMAKALGYAFVALNAYEIKFNSGLTNDYYEFKQDLLIMAYLSRRDILERIEEFDWALTSPLAAPMISRNRISLLYALQLTIGRLKKFADEINIGNEIQEILDKGTQYEVMKELTPSNMKFQSAMVGKVLMRYRYKNIITLILRDNGIIDAESDGFIIIKSSTSFLALIREDDKLHVTFSPPYRFHGGKIKEWYFDKNIDDMDIFIKVFSSNL